MPGSGNPTPPPPPPPASLRIDHRRWELLRITAKPGAPFRVDFDAVCGTAHPSAGRQETDRHLCDCSLYLLNAGLLFSIGIVPECALRATPLGRLPTGSCMIVARRSSYGK